jgi:hypothetical protein
MTWFAQLRAAMATPSPVVRYGIVDRDPAVASLVERCGRITPEETRRLAGAWAAVEADPEVRSSILEGERRCGADADEAADAADWAFRKTLRIPGDGALYAPHDPVYGRAIRTIHSHAMAVAAGALLPAALAEAMSGPWREAIEPS